MTDRTLTSGTKAMPTSKPMDYEVIGLTHARYGGRDFYGEHASDMAELAYLRDWKRWGESKFQTLMRNHSADIAQYERPAPETSAPRCEQVITDRLRQIANLIDSRPVMGYWPSMMAEADALFLRSLSDALASPQTTHPLIAVRSAQETSAQLTDDSEPASVDWRSQKALACQHDLQKPDTTIEVDGEYNAKCSVCKTEWSTR